MGDAKTITSESLAVDDDRSSGSPFDRSPQQFIDAIPVFLSDDDLARMDEYESGNPYRNATTKVSSWDRFRLATIQDNTCGDVILDAGCGEGELTSRLVGNRTVEAFDISISAVRLAKANVSGACFAVADAMDPPYRASRFDCIVLANLFEHVVAPCVMLEKFHELLRPGGRLVLSTPSRYRTVNFRRVLRGKTVRFNNTRHVTEYTNGQVREMLRWCGFSLDAIHSNLRCGTIVGTAAAHMMQWGARLVGSQVAFGDPTIYVAHRT